VKSTCKLLVALFSLRIYNSYSCGGWSNSSKSLDCTFRMYLLVKLLKTTMKSFIFWQRWLFYSSLLFAMFGIAFAIYGSNALFLPYNNALAQAFGFGKSMPSFIEPFRVFICSPLGGTIACCYILLAIIALYPFQRKERWARNAIIVAFGVWVVLDSAICICYGVYFQIYLISGFSVLTKALPIIFTWKNFTTEKLILPT
jgi:hypothetical protein